MTILVLGGRSEIGMAIATRLAPDKRVVLAARRPEALDEQETALRAAGARAVDRVGFDADDLEAHPALLRELTERYGPIEVAVVAFGILGEAARAEREVEHALEITRTDYTAQVSVLTLLANLLRAQTETTGQPAWLVVFSSIAGARVRRANYVYGAAKAGLDGFASGLADALHGSRVRLLLVRPGFVIGNMTAGMDPAPLSRTADQVADATVAALRAGKREVWVPGILRWVAALMRVLPRPLWRRMPR